MKSSSKPPAAPAFQSWSPAELSGSQAGTPPVDLSGLMSVFQEDRAQAAARAAGSGRLIKRSHASGAPAAWMPGDFGSPQPAARPHWQPAVVPGVISPASDPNWQARETAEEILDKARRQADQIVRSAEKRSDEIILHAHQAGWAAAEAESESILATAREMVQQVITWREDMLAQSESAVLALVKDIARQLFAEGVTLDPDTLQKTFNRALEDARALGDLRIYVNPEDAARLDPYWREFQVSISGHQLQVIPSEAIHPGGCFINGQLGAVDARVETKLKAMMESLTEGNGSTEVSG